MKKIKQTSKKNSKGRSQLKWSFFLLTFLIIILQFYSLLYKLPFDASMSNKKMGFFNLFFYNLTQSFTLWIPLLQFVLIQSLLQIIFVITIYYCATHISSLIRIYKNVFFTGIVLWVNTQLCTLLWNAYLFPYSYYAQWMKPIFSTTIGHMALIILLIITTSIAFLALTLTLISLFKQKPKITLSISVTCLLVFSLFNLGEHFQIPLKNKTNNPNVVLILTDSLRPDYVNLKINNQYLLPHLHELLSDSIFFPNAFTTLGRSTPGLVTMMTGKYPKNNGARFNLIEAEELKLKDSLPIILKKQGYENLLFADSLQFININSEFGFDKVFSPKRGIYDFIFTFINDLPLSNLLTNTTLGECLFPYNHANRISYYTYLPEAFVNFFRHHLQFLKIDKPVFITIDLTLPHWPYVWARQDATSVLPYRYLDALKALDKQLAGLMPIMQQKGILNNAIVIVASDHGDSFGVPGDRYIREQNFTGTKDRLDYITKYPYTISPSQTTQQLIGLDTSTGHGTDLLSSAQLNTTLAFRFYGMKLQSKTIQSRVALIDIAPTILDLLNLPAIPHSDGLSLKPLMNNINSNHFNARPIFIESEIEIPTIDVTQKNQSQSAINHLIDQYADLYYVDLDTQGLVLKPEAVRKLLKEKQRGIIKDNWLLVHFPGTNNTQSAIINGTKAELDKCYYAYQINNTNSQEKKYICYFASPTNPYYVLINLENYQWQVLFDQDAQHNIIFKNLMSDLKQFYGNEM